MSLRVLGAGLLLVLQCAWGFYVPGTHPEEYEKGQRLEVQVSSVDSVGTELPYDYYKMPFCTPPNGVKRNKSRANLGTILMGLRFENSVYNFTVLNDQKAQLACQPEGYYKALDKKDLKKLQHLIENDYMVNLILDNLPVTSQRLEDDLEFMNQGYYVGVKEGNRYYINNHLDFTVLYHPTHGEYRVPYGQGLNGLDARKLLMEGSLQEDMVVPGRMLSESSARPDLYMVVGFEVRPCSIYREAGKTPDPQGCEVPPKRPMEIKEGSKIVYTYSVHWKKSDVKWASRWDAYLKMPGGKVHWFSIMNSVLIVLVMATLVAMILIRTVWRDLAKYEQLMVDGNGDMKDEAGWKLVSGDVFRAPASSASLCVQVGSGVQIICTTVVTLLLATIGFLSPASRGLLLTAAMVLYVILSVTSGVGAVLLWGLLERTYVGWRSISLRVSLYFPGITMLIFTIINIVIKHTGTTGAVPVGTYFSIVAVWFLVSIPLTFVGGLLATQVAIRDYPVKTNQIPRHIPPAPLVAHNILLFLSAGILPFGTMFIELYFAMTSLWQGYFYYLFGYVFIIGFLTVVINAEIAVLCTYVQLCAEDYLWWWRSFRRGGSVALYVAIYAVSFLITSPNLRGGFIASFLYLSYMSILVLGFYFAMGTIGFLASFAFVYYVFKAVKQD